MKILRNAMLIPRRIFSLALLTVSLGLLACDGQADVIVDFSPDSASDGFFTRFPEAKQAVEQAAADLSAALDTPLASFRDNPHASIAGSYGQSVVTFNWQMIYNDPSTNVQKTWETSALGEGDVQIFVGMDPLPDPLLGVGGSGGQQVSFGGFGFPGELGLAFQEALAANDIMSRGAGPVIQRFEVRDIFETSDLFEVVVGLFGGSLTMDNDTNDDGRIDTDDQLRAYWHFDPYSGVPAEKVDFYSVALHEMLHVLGIGGSKAWEELSTDAGWLGSAAETYGSDLVSADGGHVDQSLMSPSISDGTMRHAVVAPRITPGQRLTLTELDLALLEDIGWTLATQSLRGDFNGDGYLSVDDLTLLSAAIDTAEVPFDLTGDGTVDSRDRDEWVRAVRSTWYGDADLNGEFNTGDLVSVFVSNKFENGGQADWSSGDWNLDGLFTTSDLILAFADGGFEQGPRAAVAVPEPTHYVVAFAVLLSYLTRRLSMRR